LSLRVIEHAQRSDTGRVRSANEDSFLVRSPLFVVADGMGGANAGEVASRKAVDVFSRGLSPGDDDQQRLAEAVVVANQEIHNDSEGDSSHRGMGTTLTAALVGDHSVSIAHVGDSRAYLIRGRQIERLTQDHTLVDELVRQGRLTEEQAAEHPQRSIITRALGPEPSVEVDTFTVELDDGDVLLLCSDGLTGMVTEQVLLETVVASRSLAAAAKLLVRKANEAGGRDNITVVLARVGVASASSKGSSSIEQKGAAGGAAEGRRKLMTAKIAGAAAAIVVFLVAAAGWRASQTVFFVGTDTAGAVTVYRGLPYDLPFGVELYQPWYVSGVPAATMPASSLPKLLDHTLRSKRDAEDLVTQLELNQLSQ
jgi:PPM family protein phosphatase